MRTIVELPDEQIEGLRHLTEATHLSRAELMRRAVSEYLAKHSQEKKDDAFGLWVSSEVDAMDYQQKLRSEWDE